MGMYGWDPACETARDELAEREAIAGELTGADLWDALAWEDGLSQQLDALFLLATVIKDQAEIGRLFCLLVEKAQDVAVDRRLK